MLRHPAPQIRTRSPSLERDITSFSHKSLCSSASCAISDLVVLSSYRPQKLTYRQGSQRSVAIMYTVAIGKPTPTQTNRPLVTTRLTTRKRIKIMKVIFFFSTQHSLQIALIITGLRIVKIQSFIYTFISLNREPTVKLRTLLGYTQS